eukprot:6491521-Amphidinium_carterae.1
MSPTCAADRDRTRMFLDITRAHPHCVVSRDLYIALPLEDPWSQTGQHCGKLKRCLYGTRDAGKSFELFVFDVLTNKLDFNGGIWSPCIFYHQQKRIHCFVYGDNFTTLAAREDQTWFKTELEKHMWCKHEGTIGPRECDSRE